MSPLRLGPRPDADQQAVLSLVDDLAANRLTRVEDDDPDAVDRARAVLAEHGLWTLGASESTGGGGADLPTTLFALARLAGAWPALAWASVQAHAAAVLLDGHPAWKDLAPAIAEGAPVAVVPLGGPGADVQLADGRLTGRVARIDPAGRRPHVVLLAGRTAYVLAPDQVEPGSPLRRTGLGGALTVSLDVDTAVTGDAVVEGAGAVAALTLLRIGGAAVAAGIAEAAAAAALDYSERRVQFGAPLTALPTVRSSLLAQLGSARTALAGALSVELDQPVAAAAALVHACDVAIDVAAAAVQSHGGYGYMSEYPVEAMLRDAVSLRAAAGAQQAASAAGATLEIP